MKTNKLIYKALSALALLCCCSAATAQRVAIDDNYRNYTVQHKQAKWFNMRASISQAAKDLDTFKDDEAWFINPHTNTRIQATHVYYDTLYVRKGSRTSLTLTLPLIHSNRDNISTQTYQRWYNFLTEKPFGYTSSNYWGQWWNNIILTPNVNCRLYSNGYVTGTSVNGQRMWDVTFDYPSDEQYQEYKRNGFSNGDGDADAGNNYYIVACDASGYLDFTDNGSVGDFNSNNNWYEPTLGIRVIFYIIGVDGRGGTDETEGWKNGMGRLENPDYYGGTGSSKKFLEEYDITFPCDHLGNQTDELVALSKFANGYRIDGDSNDNLNVTISSTNNTKFRLLSGGNHNGASGGNESERITLNGENRAIFFRPQAANAREPWSVPDGTTATIIVTKDVGNRPNSTTTYNIAKFNLTFRKNTRLLTQHELARLDNLRLGAESETDGVNDVGDEDWYQRSYLYRTPEYLRSNYTEVTSRTFDYDPDVPGMFANSGYQSWYYPFPLDWGYSSYAFFDGSTTQNFDGATDGKQGDTGPAYNWQPFVEWGTYAITNHYIGYGDIVKNSQKEPKDESLGGRNADGYFLYVDASDKPGKVVTLPFTENLCDGTELFVSAWVKSADEDTGASENSAMLFTINGIDADGNKTPLYRQSTGQITTTTFLTSSDGDEYTGSNGYGSGQNDWYQIAFSFINNSDLADQFVSYELQVDNNCGASAGGDFYLDEIRVYVSQPTATVTQKDFTCSGERSLLSTSLDWEQLCERTGANADEADTSKEPENIDFCFIDEAKYNALIGDNASPTQDEIIKALEASVVKIGSSEDPDPGTGEYYDREIGSLYYKMVFSENTEYKPTEQNLAIKNGDNGRYFFYRTGTAEDEDRKLIVDFYSAMSPNTRYLMLIVDGKTDGTVSTIADFAAMYYDPCGIKSPVYVTSQTLLKINGEIADPRNDLCEGQTFNFTSQMRVPQLVENPDYDPNVEGSEQYIVARDPETGEELYTPLDTEVFFDWFFGTEEEFNAANSTYGGRSLATALSTLRDIQEYRDVANLDGVTSVEEDPGVHSALTQEDINLIKSYLEMEAPEGGHYSKLVLHQTALDIAILKDGLDLVISPITTIRPSNISEDAWNKICWEYVPLHLNASGKSPKLFAGRSLTDYPEGFNPGLRIGLKQIEEAKFTLNDNGKSVRISLRGAEYTDENVDHLGLIESLGDIDYTQIYLIETNDPKYTSLVHVENFDQYRYPIGKIKSLHAQLYETGSDFNDYARVQFYLDKQTLEDGTKFTFAPREGYTYTFAINFAEKGREINNSCWGSFPMTMKVVPEYLVWQGDENDNWNNDANWKRAKASDLKIKDNSYTDYAEDELTETGNGFVPMLFSNVVMPKDSKVELYMAGYREGGGVASWDGANNGRKPDHIGDPTQDIQYDLMVYDTDPDTHSNNLTTQRFRVNICNDIHFAPGAQMLHAEQLLYNKAWMDVSVPTKTWTLVSTPLRDVYAGDWYTKSTGTQAKERYFTGITFDDGGYSRLDPAVYQRSWDEDATIVEDQTTNAKVSFNTSTPMWSAAYNDASVPYTAGAGFSIKAANASDGTAGSLVFRFPKADTDYDVSTGTIDRTNEGRLFISGLLDRSDPLALKRNDDVSLTLDASQDGKYMIVGNPYMAPLDLQAFLTENSGLLTGAYWTETEKGPGVGGTDGNNWLTPDASSVIPPYGAFFVERKADATGDNTIKFTADMQKFVSDAGSGTETTAFTITADNETGRSGAVLAYTDNAVNRYEATEDVQLMRNLLGNNANELSVYTVAGDKAASVNRVKDAQQIPLGVFAADDDVTTLTFTGVAALMEPSLYDAEMNTDTPLTEGYTLTVNGASHGRYFIRAKGAGEGTTGITDVETGDGGVSVYSVVQGQVVVSAGAELREVRVYSVGGALLKSESIDGGRTAVTISGVDSGVAIVRVTTADGVATRKITVR